MSTTACPCVSTTACQRHFRARNDVDVRRNLFSMHQALSGKPASSWWCKGWNLVWGFLWCGFESVGKGPGRNLSFGVTETFRIIYVSSTKMSPTSTNPKWFVILEHSAELPLTQSSRGIPFGVNTWGTQWLPGLQRSHGCSSSTPPAPNLQPTMAV